jgi:hypothetical protein
MVAHNLISSAFLFLSHILTQINICLHQGERGLVYTSIDLYSLVLIIFYINTSKQFKNIIKKLKFIETPVQTQPRIKVQTITFEPFNKTHSRKGKIMNKKVYK